jgi:hypothetical protein
MNIEERLTEFDTRLGMFDDYTYLSKSVKLDSPLLLQQAELSRTVTSLHLHAKVHALRQSFNFNIYEEREHEKNFILQRIRKRRMSPIVYNVANQKSNTSGPLPGYNGTATWEDLNTATKTAKESIKNDYLAYLQADLDGNSTAKSAAVDAMNTTLAAVASLYSNLGNLRFYLLNNASVVRAANPPSDVGKIEYGRTEIIHSQIDRYALPNNIRTSDTTQKFTWYAGLAMGAFAKDCEKPAHVLKVALAQPLPQ